MSELEVDIPYCASSFLMYRTVVDGEKAFSSDNPPRKYNDFTPRLPVRSMGDLEVAMRSIVEKRTGGLPVAIALSGGIDSAIMAKLAPPGSIAYTFKCVVPGVEVADESPRALLYAEECGLEHRIVEVTWEDMESLSTGLMRHKGAPIHSIEVQIYKAATCAAADGFDTMLFGESSDVTYGGLDGLLSRDWVFGDFVDRYVHVMPWRVLRDWRMDLSPFERICRDGRVDAHEFVSTFFRWEGLGSYLNATDLAGIGFLAPFAETYLDSPLDFARVRGGESKYLVRELFGKLYPGWEIPRKTPMPRPTEEWMAGWDGPTRQEFWPHCVEGMTGDQKWMVWALERFLDMMDGDASVAMEPASFGGQAGFAIRNFGKMPQRRCNGVAFGERAESM